jgi:CubicO group peptidase (beta-lactamase class C family)
MTHSESRRKIGLYFLVLVFLNTASAIRMIGQEVSAHPSDPGKLADDYFLPLVANKNVRAAAVIVVDSQKTVFAKCYGTVDLGHSFWRAASVSKALTAIGVMRLVEQGKLNLDIDVNQYLKTFHIPNTYASPITLRELLEHRSGLDDRFIGDGFRSGEQPPMRQLMARFLPDRVYAPAQVEFYSNYGYGLVGAIIEDVTGARFEDYMQANVLEPLGMNRSSFQQPLPSDRSALTAPGKWWYQHAAPAGGLSVTAEDAAKFLIATLQQDNSLISAETFRTMTAPMTAPSGLVNRFGYFTGKRHGYQLVGATGDLGTFHNVLVAVPEKGFGIVILVSGNISPGAVGFYNRFSDAQLGSQMPGAVRSATVPRENASNYEHNARFSGLYRTVRYPHHEMSKTFIVFSLTRVAVERDGALRFRGARWIQTAPLEFEKEDGSETVSFQEDDAGKIKFMATSIRGETDERIAWYESGYVNIVFYVLFTIFFGVGTWRAKGVLRWLSALALVHSLGWVAVGAITGPGNLVMGLPWPLKGILWIGTAVPVMAVSAIYIASRRRDVLAIAAAVLLACYIPFVLYWNLHA